VKSSPTRPAKKDLVGVDVFLDWAEDGRDPTVLGRRIESAAVDGLKLKMITNRGVKVYPQGFPETFLADHWRCRFTSGDQPIVFPQVLALLERLHGAGLEVIKTEHLYAFDGERAYSLGQGE
jgi:isocitrate dehydrogenase